MYAYCYVCSVLYIPFHCVVLCIVCVYMCTVLLPPGVNPIAVNKYNISYPSCCVHESKDDFVLFGITHVPLPAPIPSLVNVVAEGKVATFSSRTPATQLKRWCWCRQCRPSYTGFWWGNLRERDYLGDPGVDGKKMDGSLGSRMWGYELDWAGSG